ncbi:MAG: Hsp33 family molecular chaperone HslO, partial [Clostridiales bacterium]
MTDYCVRGMTADGGIRYKAAVTTALCEEARMRHDTWPVVTAALGRLLTAGAFFGLNLKGNDTVTLRVEGGGPIGTLLVVSQANGTVRGYVAEPHVDLPREIPGKLPVGKAVGDEGFLYVLKDMGLKEPYTGSVQLLSGEIGDDVA